MSILQEILRRAREALKEKRDVKRRVEEEPNGLG